MISITFTKGPILKIEEVLDGWGHTTVWHVYPNPNERYIESGIVNQTTSWIRFHNGPTICIGDSLCALKPDCHEIPFEKIKSIKLHHSEYYYIIETE